MGAVAPKKQTNHASFTVYYPDQQMHNIYIYNIINIYVVHVLVWIIKYGFVL